LVVAGLRLRSLLPGLPTLLPLGVPGWRTGLAVRWIGRRASPLPLLTALSGLLARLPPGCPALLALTLGILSALTFLALSALTLAIRVLTALSVLALSALALGVLSGLSVLALSAPALWSLAWPVLAVAPRLTGRLR
jgi:hypothetical protein